MNSVSASLDSCRVAHHKPWETQGEDKSLSSLKMAGLVLLILLAFGSMGVWSLKKSHDAQEQLLREEIIQLRSEVSNQRSTIDQLLLRDAKIVSGVDRFNHALKDSEKQ